jgi:hypothetical protein
MCSPAQASARTGSRWRSSGCRARSGGATRGSRRRCWVRPQGSGGGNRRGGPGAPQAREHGRVPHRLPRRHRRRHRAGADLGPAHGARDHRHRGRDRARGGAGRRGRHRAAGPSRARDRGRRARRDAGAGADRAGRGRSGPARLHRLHLGHLGRAARGRPCASRGLGAADDVGGVVRPWRGRPAPARGRVQLDLHARDRASRSLGHRRDGADPGRGRRRRRNFRSCSSATTSRSSRPRRASTGRCWPSGPLPPLRKLRHGLSAGEKMPETLRARWEAATGTAVHEAFGMSECSTFVSGSPARPAPPGTLGYPQPGRRVAVVDGDGAPCPAARPGRWPSIAAIRG